MKLKTYEIIVPVTRATGTRLYRVDAKNAADAIRIYEAGDAECFDEQLEAETMGDPETPTEVKP